MTEGQKGQLAMLAFSALVAGSFSLGSQAAPFIDPAALSAVHYAIAGVIVGAAAWATGGRRRKAFASPWRYAVLGTHLTPSWVILRELSRGTAAPPQAILAGVALAVAALWPLLHAAPDALQGST